MTKLNLDLDMSLNICMYVFVYSIDLFVRILLIELHTYLGRKYIVIQFM